MTGVRPSSDARPSHRAPKSKRVRAQAQRSSQRISRPTPARSRSSQPSTAANPPTPGKPLALPAPSDPASAPSHSRRQPPELRRLGPYSDPLGLILLRATVLGVTLALLVGGISRLLQPGIGSQPETRATALATLPPSPLSLSQESQALKARLAPLLEQRDLTPHLMMVDLDSGTYVQERAAQGISAASLIKVPILVAFLQAVDAGQVDLDEPLSLTPELIATGSGTLQTQPVGTQISALQAATLMITISDNTATNLLIERLGGLEAVNRQFRPWQLQQTSLVALLPDLEGNNTTSPMDMVSLLSQIESGKWLSRRSRDRFFDILRRTQNRTLLPQGLGDEARIAHKTGDIRSMLGDVGMIDLANGQRYLLAVQVERQVPNDPQAQELIQQISKTIYRFWSEPTPMSGDPTISPTP